MQQPSAASQSLSTPNSPARRLGSGTSSYEYAAAALANKNNNIGMLNGNIPVTIPNTMSKNFLQNGGNHSGTESAVAPVSSKDDDIWTKKILPDTRRNTWNRIQRQKSDPGGGNAQIYSYLNKNNNAHRHGIVGMNALHGYESGSNNQSTGFPLTNGNLSSRYVFILKSYLKPFFLFSFYLHRSTLSLYQTFIFKNNNVINLIHFRIPTQHLPGVRTSSVVGKLGQIPQLAGAPVTGSSQGSVMPTNNRY